MQPLNPTWPWAGRGPSRQSPENRRDCVLTSRYDVTRRYDLTAHSRHAGPEEALMSQPAPLSVIAVVLESTPEWCLAGEPRRAKKPYRRVAKHNNLGERIC